MEWRLTNAEWETLQPILQHEPSPQGGRPRVADDRAIAEICLYRFFRRHRADHYHCFGWNDAKEDLPKRVTVSPATANRRFREWQRNGSWTTFWHALLQLRSPKPEITEATGRPQGRPKGWRVKRTRGHFPVGDVIAELERAYLFFNHRFFGNRLPQDIGLAVEQRARFCRGYFCSRLWHKGKRALDHIAIHGTTLGTGAADTCGVLLHEMVHLRNSLANLVDCTARNQYHNMLFRDVAILCGLQCEERHRSHGFAVTSLNDEGRAAVEKLKPNEAVFEWYG